MNRFSLNYMMKQPNIFNNVKSNNIFNNVSNKKRVFYVCSSGGCGSTVLFNYLKNFGNVYHIHDRYPPNELEYIGKENTNKEVYSEWFNGVKIPENELENYKVIFIYRNPLQVIYSRLAQPKGPNVTHLQHIKCDNNGYINLFDVLKTRKDLYGLEQFFDNYTTSKERNYNIYCVKYELFWSNISLFNKIMEIPDIPSLYPVKNERPKEMSFFVQLSIIYNSLIRKMNSMKFIEIIKPKQKELPNELF